MAMLSIGDLAQSYTNRRANTRLTAELGRLGQELTSGVKSDVRKAVAGDSGPLSAIDRGLTRLEGYKTATDEARLFTQATQDVLGRVAGQIGAMAPLLAPILDGTNTSAMTAASVRARDAFSTSVAALNTSVGGRHLLSGVSSGVAPLAAADAMLGAVTSAVAGLTGAQDISAAIDAWFAPGGGFDTDGYAGGTGRAAVRISPDDDVRLDITADDPAIRATLGALAKAALAANGATTLDTSGRAELLKEATASTLDGEVAMVGLRARIGAAQERVDLANARNEAEAVSLKSTRLAIVAADPYETASRMEQVQAQLESLYTVTARMSRLNLTNYL